jgi:hypothetical protein
MPDRNLSIEGVQLPRFLYGTAWKEDRTGLHCLQVTAVHRKLSGRLFVLRQGKAWEGRTRCNDYL